MLGLVKISTQPTISIRYSHLLVPATRCARGLQPSFIHPEGWRSAETALGCSGTRSVPKRVQDARERAFARHAKRFLGALRPPAGGRAPLGAPPWRFSAGVPCFHLRHFLRIRAASSSRPGRSAWRTGSRASRGFGYEPPPRDATPRSVSGSSLENAPLSQAGDSYTPSALRSQVLSARRMRFF